MFLLKTPWEVLTVGTLMTPLSPGCTSTITPSCHRMHSRFLSIMMTTEHVLISPLYECHFCLFCSSLRYSTCHLLQKSWRALVTNRHVLSPFSGTVKRLSSDSIVSRRPIKIWARVRARGSPGSENSEHKRRELRTASIWIAYVFNSSKMVFVYAL